MKQDTRDTALFGKLGDEPNLRCATDCGGKIKSVVFFIPIISRIARFRSGEHFVPFQLVIRNISKSSKKYQIRLWRGYDSPLMLVHCLICACSIV